MPRDGLDPIFRTVDGSNSPKADVSTVKARREAFSMLLNKGVIRIGLPIPAGAEFSLVGVDDPYGYASASELSLFRRPLPVDEPPLPHRRDVGRPRVVRAHGHDPDPFERAARPWTRRPCSTT